MTDFKKIEKKARENSDSLYQARLDRSIPVAREIINIINSSDPHMGDMADKQGVVLDSVNKNYMAIAEKVLIMMLEKNMHFADKDFVFQLVQQAISGTQDKVKDSLSMTFDRLQTALFGKDILDMTMLDMNDKIKEAFPSKEENKA